MLFNRARTIGLGCTQVLQDSVDEAASKGLLVVE